MVFDRKKTAEATAAGDSASASSAGEGQAVLQSVKPDAEEISEEIGAYVKGDYIGIEKVNDPTFAQKILGEGVAIVPADNKICAPADVSVEMVADTKHAVTLRTKAGNGILIHVGLDTVQLGGKYFDVHVKVGQELKKGDCIMDVDFEKIAREGYDITVCMIFAELKEGCRVEGEPGKTDAVGDKIAVIRR